jgi:hypothetical protein
MPKEELSITMVIGERIWSIGGCFGKCVRWCGSGERKQKNVENGKGG